MTPSGTRHFIYGFGNQLGEIRDGSDVGPLLGSFDYDDDGRVTARRDSAGALVYELARTVEGRVGAAVTPEGFHVYGYDPLGMRVREGDASGTRWAHLEGEHLEAVYDGAGALQAKYLRGSLIDEVVNAYYFDSNGKPTNYTYHHDALQSVVGLSGHAGSVEETIRYRPFGVVFDQTGGSPNALRFTGRNFNSESGLYYYRARYYDPDIGRFLSEDPLGFGGGDVNLYAYATNNPLRFNDPTGAYLQYVIGAGVGAVVGVVAQGVGDYVRGESSGIQGYIGSAVGGATAGVVFVTTGNAYAAGAAGGAAGNTTTQFVANVTGAQSGFDGTDFVYSTGFGAAAGAVPGLKIPGITAGNGSFSHVASTQLTKLANGTTRTVAATTLGKILGSELAENITATGAEIVMDQVYDTFEPGIDDFFDSFSQTSDSRFDYPSTGDSEQLFNVYCTPKCL